MPLHDTLRALNSLVRPEEPASIITLWRQLEVEFVTEHGTTERRNKANDIPAPPTFQSWALAHATDASLLATASARKDILRRWNTSLTHFNASPGVIIFLFGDTILNSRVCAEALTKFYHPEPLKPPKKRRGSTRSTTPRPKGTSRTTVKDEARSKTDVRQKDPDLFPDEDKNSNKHHPDTPKRPRRRAYEDMQGEYEGRTHSEDAQSSSSLASDREGADLRLQTSSPPSPSLRGRESEHAGFGFPSADFNDDDEDGDSLVRYPVESPSAISNNILRTSPLGGETPCPMSPRRRLGHLSVVAEQSFVSPPASGIASSTGSPNRPSASHRKRTLGIANILEATDHNDVFAPPAKMARLLLQDIQPDTSQPSPPEPTPSSCRTTKIGVAEILDSTHRLEPDGFLNDTIINTMAHRLAADDVGIVDSYMVANKTRTPSARHKLQHIVSRSRVLIFVNHDFHWVVYLWASADGLLLEYNSLPGTRGDLADSCAMVTEFLRWVHSDPSMDINLESAASQGDRVIQLRNYHRRKGNFQQLLAPGASTYTTSTLFLADLRRMADHEQHAIQKSILACVIDSIHVSYREALASAVGAAGEAALLLEISRGWEKVKAKTEDLLSSFAELGAAGGEVAASLPEPDRARYRNMGIIKNAAKNMADHWDSCYTGPRSVREAREVAEAGFVSARVHLLVLSYAVRKFRKHESGSGKG
ncbi:hypothetical protein LY76DRAFT_647023 [Colletotrichum caudatum]|nr:hypothetical protein LY76DRAFT_647023 [Colletotrichum caudatum]